MKKIIIFIFIILIFTGCNKSTISSTSFKEKMELKKFKVTNSIDQFPDDVLSEAYIASNKKYNIEFYATKTRNQAAYAYSITKTLFKNEVSDYKLCKENMADNYAKYYCLEDNKFNLISIIDNTYILVSSTSDNSKEILGLIEYLGY